MNKAKDKIKQAWEENPLLVIAIATGAATAAVKVVEAVVSANNSRTWKKEVNRRVNNPK